MNFSQTLTEDIDSCCAGHQIMSDVQSLFDTRKHDLHKLSCILNFNVQSSVCELVRLGWMEILANSFSLISWPLLY